MKRRRVVFEQVSWNSFDEYNPPIGWTIISVSITSTLSGSYVRAIAAILLEEV